MGGAAGHISHVWENRSLTFNDIVDIMSSAVSGKLENVVEKFDGMQVSFTHNGREIYFARNKTEMLNGGLNRDSLTRKFADKPAVRDAFVAGHAVLDAAVGCLPRYVKSIFSAGKLWYSAEIMCSKNSNVICYDSNVIVFHEFPTYAVHGGSLVVIDGADGIKLLKQNIDAMQNAAKMLNWRIHAPEILNIQGLTDGTFLNRAVDELHNAALRMNCTMGHSIGAYLENGIRRAATQELSMLPQHIIKNVVSRCLEHSGCLTLAQIKKHTPIDFREHVGDFVNSSPRLIKSLLEPIELTVMKFTTHLLMGMKSAFLANPSAEAARIRSELSASIESIKSVGDASMLDQLNTQMKKIGDAANVEIGTEGVVFVYKGAAYKFTGYFGPVNQILGMLRYSR